MGVKIGYDLTARPQLFRRKAQIGSYHAENATNTHLTPCYFIQSYVTYLTTLHTFLHFYTCTYDECIIGLWPPRCIVLEQSNQPRVKGEMKYSGVRIKGWRIFQTKTCI